MKQVVSDEGYFIYDSIKEDSISEFNTLSFQKNTKPEIVEVNDIIEVTEPETDPSITQSQVSRRLKERVNDVIKDSFPQPILNKLPLSLKSERKKKEQLMDKIKELEEKLKSTVSSEVYESIAKDNEVYRLKIKQKDKQIDTFEREISNLQLRNKKINFEGMKLRKTNEFLKQNQKGHEVVIRGLKRDVKELKEKIKTLEETESKKDKETDIIIHALVDLAEKFQIEKESIKKVLEKHNKEHLLIKSNKSAIGQELNTKYKNLEVYDNLFNDSSDGDFDFESSNPSPDIEERISKEQSEEEPIAPLITNNSEKKVTGANFHTNKEAIRNSLAIQSNIQKKVFKTIHHHEMNEEENQQAFERIIADLKNETINDFQKSIPDEYIDELFIEFDKFVKSPNNPTTFTFVESDKLDLKAKFKEKEGQTLNRVVLIISDLILKHVDFLENHIKQLTTKNSDLELKMADLKNEMDFMLQNYMEKNKKAQQIINKNNAKLIKLKSEKKLLKNISKRKLMTNVSKDNVSNVASIDEAVEIEEKKMRPSKFKIESDKTKKEKTISQLKNDTPIVSFNKKKKEPNTDPKPPKSVFKKKKKNIRYKVPVEPEDLISDLSEEMRTNSKGNDDNIWNKVTDFFTRK